ncbi:MAG: hypothetical protein IKQ55_13005 [Kiritimatiellae bacterium]|nr:hypothetical protein [Kiritimatiellia bacterium]
MKSTIRNAVLAIAAAFAMVLPARAEEAAAPAAFVQIEMRGLDALFSAADRIAAPYVPAGQAKGMFIGACGARGINPFEVIDSGGTVRLMACGNLDENCFLVDLPAAGGDAAACLDKWTEALGTNAPPEGFDMPEGGRFLRSGPPMSAGSLLFPRGERIVVIDHTQPNPIPPAQALALFDATPAVPAGGVLAAAVDFEAMRPLLANSKAGTTGARMRDLLSSPAFACRAFAFGIGLDEGDRFRTDWSVAYVPDSPQARHGSGIGAPVSPLANAILFPDAVAAGTYHQELSGISDDELRAVLNGKNGLASVAGEANPRTAAVRDALAAAYIPFLRMLGDEYAVAYLPAGEGEEAGGSALLAFPADPQAALDGVPDCFNGMIGAFADFLRSAADDDDDVPDVVDALSRLRVEPAGERSVRETSVRRYVVRLEGEDETPAGDVGAFEAAAAGPALYLGTLPDGRLGDVLADLAAGHTAKGPVAAMPAFAAAYGEAPEGAACGYVRLRPVLRAFLPKLQAFVDNVIAEDDSSIVPLARSAFDSLSAFANDPTLPDITLGTTQRWMPGDARLESIVSMPLADFHVAIDALYPRHGPASEIIGTRGGTGR